MGPFVMIAERNWEHPWKEKQIYIIFAICIPNEHLLLWRFALPASPDDLHRMLASNIRRNRFLLISISQAFLNDIIIIIYWCAQYLHEFNFKMYHTHHVSARSEWVIEWMSMATHIKIKLIISLNNDVCCEKKQQEDEEEEKTEMANQQWWWVGIILVNYEVRTRLVLRWICFHFAAGDFMDAFIHPTSGL